MSMSRKDYGESATISKTDPIIKGLNGLNAPYSIQSLGFTLTPSRVLSTSLPSLEALGLGDRLSYGHSLCVVSGLVMSEDEVPVLTGVELSQYLPGLEDPRLIVIDQ